VQGSTNAAEGMEKVRPEVEKLAWAMPGSGEVSNR